MVKPREYTQILDKSEKILWEGQPKFGPFLLRSFSFLPFGIIFLGMSLSFMSFSLFMEGMTSGINSLLTYIQGPFIPGFFFIFKGVDLIFVLVGLYITIGWPIRQLLEYPIIRYVITNKRVIIQGGIIGRDFAIADYDKIQSASVNMGVADKLFGGNSGTISISTNTIQPVMLKNVVNPYQAFELFKKVSHDVKTDIEYPNFLRPSTNPGYQTKYSPKK